MHKFIWAVRLDLTVVYYLERYWLFLDRLHIACRFMVRS